MVSINDVRGILSKINSEQEMGTERLPERSKGSERPQWKPAGSVVESSQGMPCGVFEEGTRVATPSEVVAGGEEVACPMAR